MSLEGLKPLGNRVIGIDASTKSLAWAIFEDGQPVSCGEIMFEGNDVYQRLTDARIKTQELFDTGELKGDFIAMEGAVMVSNKEVVIKLAYVFGAILSILVQNAQVITVKPLEWQTAVGVPNLKAHEKLEIKKQYPDHAATWYKNKGREIRKQRIADWAQQFFDVTDKSDNVSDAIGLSWYAATSLTRRS